jgi:ribosomal protein S19E (S16A)
VLFEKTTAMTVGNVEPQRGQTRSQPVIDNVLQHLQAIGLVMKVRIIVQMIVA